MNTFQQDYATALAIPVTTTVPGKIVTFPAEKPGCVSAFIAYTPGEPGRSLNIKIELGTTGGLFFDLLSDNSVDITDDAVVVLSCPGGPPKIRLFFTSTGAPGPDDVVTIKLAGLPTGTNIA